MAFDRQGRLYVSSRFEGAVYRVAPTERSKTFATHLGVACGLAFDPDGTLYVGDRSGRSSGRPDGGASFRNAPGQRRGIPSRVRSRRPLYVTAPTLAPCDSLYRIDRRRQGRRLSARLRPPAGAGVRRPGALYVVDALAGGSGLYRLRSPRGGYGAASSAASLIGVAFDPRRPRRLIGRDGLPLEVPVRGS